MYIKIYDNINITFLLTLCSNFASLHSAYAHSSLCSCLWTLSFSLSNLSRFHFGPQTALGLICYSNGIQLRVLLGTNDVHRLIIFIEWKNVCFLAVGYLDIPWNVQIGWLSSWVQLGSQRMSILYEYLPSRFSQYSRKTVKKRRAFWMNH